jgi:hypothetical protein
MQASRGVGVAVARQQCPHASAPGILISSGIAAATVAALALPRAVAVVARMTRRPDLRPLPLGAVVVAGAATAISWLGYGVAFWLLARGTLGATALGLAPAVGVFAAGYITGLLALFAPGGRAGGGFIAHSRRAWIRRSHRPWLASRVLLTLTDCSGAARPAVGTGRPRRGRSAVGTAIRLPSPEGSS